MRLLDELYSLYRDNPDEHIERLLTAVRRASLMYALAKGYSDPEDISQEVTIFVWNKLPELVATRSDAFSFHIYVHSIKEYIAGTYLRKLLKGHSNLEFDESLYIPPSDFEDYLPMSDVPEDLKEAMTLLLMGYTQKETSERLSISPEALESRLRRFKKKKFS